MDILKLSTVFHVLNHRLLLAKMEAVYISAPLRNWVAAFLNHRQMKVQVTDTFFPLISINSGVPPGSIFGPMLFLIFDLPSPILSKD